MINNLVIVSGTQQRDSAILIHASIPLRTPLGEVLSDRCVCVCEYVL